MLTRRRQQHLMHRSSNINWVRGTRVWVKSEKKRERERERLWWVSLLYKRDRRDRTTARGCHSSRHTHEYTVSDWDVLLCLSTVSHGVRNALLWDHIQQWLCHIYWEIKSFPVFFIFIFNIKFFKQVNIWSFLLDKAVHTTRSYMVFRRTQAGLTSHFKSISLFSLGCRQRHLKDPSSAALTRSWPWLRWENPPGADKDRGVSCFPLLHTSHYVLSFLPIFVF